MSHDLRVGSVCLFNLNRSMEAHALLSDHGFSVASYGTQSDVRLPGLNNAQPLVFKFGTPYKQMHDEVRQLDVDAYMRNGVLSMLARNARVKRAPQRFQDDVFGVWDVVIVFDERAYAQVVEELRRRAGDGQTEVHALGLPTQDQPAFAAVGARLALSICLRLEELPKAEWRDWLKGFAVRHDFQLMHEVFRL